VAMTPVASPTKPPSGWKTNIKRTREQSEFLGKTLTSALCDDLASERHTDAVVYSKEGTYLNLHKVRDVNATIRNSNADTSLNVYAFKKLSKVIVNSNLPQLKTFFM
jgi:hypothetical protein